MKKSAPCDKLRPRQKAYPHLFSSCPKMQAWSPQASSEGPCRGRLMGYPQGRKERNGTTNSKTLVHSWCALNVGLGPNFSPSGLRRVRQRGVKRDRGLRSQLWVGTWDAQDSTILDRTSTPEPEVQGDP